MDMYVSNLAPATTREELLKAFSAHGEVSSVSLLTDQMKNGQGVGAGRGYGFVVMPDKVQAQAALAALDHRDLHGRPMGVQVARANRNSRHRR